MLLCFFQNCSTWPFYFERVEFSSQRSSNLRNMDALLKSPKYGLLLKPFIGDHGYGKDPINGKLQTQIGYIMARQNIKIVCTIADDKSITKSLFCHSSRSRHGTKSQKILWSFNHIEKIPKVIMNHDENKRWSEILTKSLAQHSNTANDSKKNEHN